MIQRRHGLALRFPFALLSSISCSVPSIPPVIACRLALDRDPLSGDATTEERGLGKPMVDLAES